MAKGRVAHIGYRRRGSALLMALMYTSLFGALAASMVMFTSSNTHVAEANDRSVRAFAAAESGMSFLLHQVRQTAKPVTAAGTIDASLARQVWSASGGLSERIAARFAGTANLQGRPVVRSAYAVNVPPIKMDPNTSFALTVTQDASDPVVLHLESVGNCGGVVRGVSMDIVMEKKIRYAVYSNVAIELGKNTVVEGDVISMVGGFSKGPPVWMLSDFRALSNQAGLDADLVRFRNYLATRDATFSNRLDVRSTAAKTAAQAQGFHDRSGDGLIDEYDVFLNRLDTTHTGTVTSGQFTDPATGKHYDPELFYLIDHLSPSQVEGGLQHAGYDDSRIDNQDGYAKVKGTVGVAVTQAAWDAWAKDASGGSKYGNGFRAHFQGPVISPDATVPPVQFGMDSSDVPDIRPANFDTTSYANRAGSAAGTTSGSVAAGSIKNATITAAMANGGTKTEGTPHGSTTIQATYRRPVFRNVRFENCKIPKGLNALFENCTFNGVTFVEMQTNITNSSNQTTTDPNDGMTWSKRMKSGSFSSTTALTSTNSHGFSEGNNLRFDSCTFNGPVASSVPTAYTHFANSWEFTGATYFQNTVDPTATILAPNTNIEMGSFSDAQTPSTLVGVVVAGNIDIRGKSYVDGSVIVCGNGASNTTLGYFGASDSSSDPTTQPEGGYGRLYLRYNPTRAMPNGISIPILLTPRTGTYTPIGRAAWVY